MSVYATVRCDADAGKHGCPNKVDISVTPDRTVAFRRDLRRAGWTTRKGADLCPVHSTTTSSRSTSS